jgi:hypothetical protein
MTYLELVNNVLRRLRETEVSSVADNSYSKMIGEFVNDSKRTVENAHDWNALKTALTVTTSSSVYNYSVVDSGQRFRVTDVINNTSKWFIDEQTKIWFDEQLLLTTPQTGSPDSYCFSGVDNNGDTKINLFPIPNGVYSVVINATVPQDDLTANATVIKVPYEPVLFLAYAKALAERGEDGGLASSEAAALYRQALADHIAIEIGRHSDESQWYWV